MTRLWINHWSWIKNNAPDRVFKHVQLNIEHRNICGLCVDACHCCIRRQMYCERSTDLIYHTRRHSTSNRWGTLNTGLWRSWSNVPPGKNKLFPYLSLPPSSFHPFVSFYQEPQLCKLIAAVLLVQQTFKDTVAATLGDFPIFLITSFNSDKINQVISSGYRFFFSAVVASCH